MSIAIELKYTARMLLKKPIFTALTILIVAIGLGLTIYAYSILNNLVFKPMTLNGDTEIVAIEAGFDYNHQFRQRPDPYHLQLLDKQSGLFEQLGFYLEGTTFAGGANSSNAKLAIARKYNATYVSWNAFELAGVQPIKGRGFTPEDFHNGAESVFVLSYQAWQRDFDGDDNIIGQMVPLDAMPSRIIGVMPEGFAFPQFAQIWQPLSSLGEGYLSPIEASGRSVYGMARLKPGVSFSQVEDAVTTFNKNIIPELKKDFIWRLTNDVYLTVMPYKHASIIQYYNVFIALFVVVFLILLLACINVSNLLLARVNERLKEVAIRVALGIPRKRLIMQMLWESIFICITGGVLAILFAAYGLEVSNAVLQQNFSVQGDKPFWWQLSLDNSAYMLLLCSVVLMIIITGLIPAIRSLSGDFNAVIRDGTRGSISKKAANAGKVLVISEILLSCVVLVIATILLVTGYSAGVADYGVDTDKRLTAQIQISPEKYPIRRNTEFEFQDRLARSEVLYKLKSALEVMPNVDAVAMMSELPGRGEGTSYFEIEGRPAAVYNENPYSNNEGVVKDSWHAIGMEMIAGRDFDHRDRDPDARSFIINQSIAEDFFPDGDAVGHRVRRVHRNREPGDWSTIIGVVSDTFHGSTMRSSSAAYNTYSLVDSWGPMRMSVAIHYNGRYVAAQASLMDAVNRVDPDIGIYHIQSYDDLIKQPMLLMLSVSQIFLFCGVIAAFLAASGIYAMAANSITQRTQEIGIRRALGSPDGKIINMFMNQAAMQLIIGLTIGIGLSLLLTSIMTDTIVISETSYLLGMFGVPILIIFMVLVATFIPAKKVIKMEPSDALHHD
ncbi:ABC transporter permease [Psychrosphaera sp. F3M07]|uniref:FtsX-like permease family protein n=1 Tax=Psychrosphaera sp. F3M07 TaxID=2841560 RepID=UPI001C095342|nr:FtsX-like permease family protein [Psychrosphaera sp. F3M07]MBU2917384.1 ABC transporter permease [Psychrosphaera sp. F3M07]